MAKKRGKYIYHDLEFKIKLVKIYLEGTAGFRPVAKEYGLKSGHQLRDWVIKYKKRRTHRRKSRPAG
jgi:transposase-like protein